MASPSITTRSLGQIVQSYAAAAQASCVKALNFAVGSVNLALGQGSGAIGLWLQQVALYILGLTRFATSLGADADSWGADWGYYRLAGNASTGSVTFSRTNLNNQAVIPVGTIVQTSDGTQSFAVTLDLGNPAYSATAGGYVIPFAVASVTVPVQCTVVGIAGNVQASTISVITTAIPNVTTVNNAAAMTNGAAAESDPAFKARFPLWLQGLQKANLAAIESAVAGVQQGLLYLPFENKDYPGTTADNGNFFLIIDDGSHNPPATLITAVYNAVYPVRGFTIRFQVYPPVTVPVNLSGTITSATGYTHANVVNAVDAAWAAYLNTLPLGSPALTIAGLVEVAMQVPGVTNVSIPTVLINGSNSDLALSVVQVPIAGTIAAA